MKHRPSLTLCATLMLALGGCAAVKQRAAVASPADSAAELRAITQQLLDAIAVGNAALWNRYTDPALVFVTEDNEVKSKPEFLATLEPLPPGFAGSARLADFRAASFGEVSVATYEVEETEIAFGQTLHARYRASDTWRHTSDGFRLVASQIFAVPHDPAAIRLAEATLDGYAGSYEVDRSTRLRLRREADHLIAEREGRPPQTLIPEVLDVFFSPGRPRSRRVFLRSADGAITGFVDRREGEDLLWRRVTD